MEKYCKNCGAIINEDAKFWRIAAHQLKKKAKNQFKPGHDNSGNLMDSVSVTLTPDSGTQNF